MKDVCACELKRSRSRSGDVSTHAFAMPITRPVAEKPMIRIRITSIFTVVMNTDRMKFP